MASCKNCGGEPLGDGRGSPGDGIPRTIGLELTSFINSDLTWKGSKGKRSSSRQSKKSLSMGLKGNRSTSRQAKKSVATSFEECRELLNQNLKSVNMPVCESEKLGVSVLGCRFTEKAEHVPIKKRRFVYRSPSPPPRDPSPHSETELVSKTKTGVIYGTAANELGQIVDRECDVDKENLGKVKALVDDGKDFSGISILAAAACSKNFVEDDGHAEDGSRVEESFVCGGPSEISANNELCSLLKGVSRDELYSDVISIEGTGSCISALPAANPFPCLKTVNSSDNGLLCGHKMEDASLQDEPVASENFFTSKGEETVRKLDLSLADERLHWDLNRAVDSWEHSFEHQSLDSSAKVACGFVADLDHGKYSGKMENSEGYELPTDLGDSKTDAGKERLTGDSKEMIHESKQSNIEDHKPHVCSDSERSIFLQKDTRSSELNHVVKGGQFEECRPSLHSQERIGTDAGSVCVPADDAKGLSASINEDQSTLKHNVGCTISDDGSSLHGVVSLYSSADNNLTSLSSYSTSCFAADEHMNISSDSQVKKQEVSPLVVLSGNSTVGIDVALDKAVSDAKEILGSLEDTSNLVDVVTLETGQPLKTELLDIVNENHSSACSRDEMPTSAMPVEDQPALSLDLKVQDRKGSVLVSAETDTSVVNCKQVATKCTEKSVELLHDPSVHSSHGGDLVNTSDRLALERPSEYYSDISHDRGNVKSSEQEVDYNSQYEDGEFRESVHAWEYDFEDMDVDYGSDNDNNLTCDALKPMKHVQEANFQTCPSGSSGSGKERSLKGKEGMKAPESGNEASPAKVTGDDLFDREVDTEKLSLSAGSTVKLSGSWGHRKFSDSMAGVGDGGGWNNLTGGCMDVMATEDTKMRMVGSREFRWDLRSHIEEWPLQDGYVKDKTYKHRNIDAGNSNPGSVREPECVGSFGRVGYTHHAHTRGEEGDHSVDYIDSHRGLKRYHSPNYYSSKSFRHPGPVNASSLDVHRYLRRSGLSVDRDEDFPLRLGFRPSREVSPIRHMTGGRGRSLRFGHRLDTRVPRGRYGGPMPDYPSGPSLNHYYPSSKKERRFSSIERRVEDPACNFHSKSPSRSRTRSPNSGSGPQTKSPSFRPEVRMQRRKSPRERSGFVADRVIGFRKMHKDHCSPPHHNSRWFDDWKDGMHHFREQARFDLWDERFDFLDFPRNYRSMRAGRFLDMEGVGRGRPRCDGDDDSRWKHGHSFGPVPPAKRFATDGPVKRLNYNGDQSFVKTQNSHYGGAAEFYGRGGSRQQQLDRGIERSIGNGQRRYRDDRSVHISKR